MYRWRLSVDVENNTTPKRNDSKEKHRNKFCRFWCFADRASQYNLSN